MICCVVVLDLPILLSGGASSHCCPLDLKHPHDSTLSTSKKVISSLRPEIPKSGNMQTGVVGENQDGPKQGGFGSVSVREQDGSDGSGFRFEQFLREKGFCVLLCIHCLTEGHGLGKTWPPAG